jgi:hypothetical protein
MSGANSSLPSWICQHDENISLERDRRVLWGIDATVTDKIIHKRIKGAVKSQQVGPETRQPKGFSFHITCHLYDFQQTTSSQATQVRCGYWTRICRSNCCSDKVYDPLWLIRIPKCELGKVVHTCNPSTQ